MSSYNRVSGSSPHTRGLQITVTVPDATKENPIREGDTLTFRTDGPYLAQLAPQGELVYMKALHAVYDAKTPLGVQLFGFSRIETVRYGFFAPNYLNIDIGYLLVAGFDGLTLPVSPIVPPFDAGTFVLSINEEIQTCEVAMR